MDAVLALLVLYGGNHRTLKKGGLFLDLNSELRNLTTVIMLTIISPETVR